MKNDILSDVDVCPASRRKSVNVGYDERPYLISIWRMVVGFGLPGDGYPDLNLSIESLRGTKGVVFLKHNRETAF